MPARSPLVRQGERWLGIERRMVVWANVRQEHSVGREIQHGSPSPWVVVSVDALHQRYPMVFAVPLSSQLHQQERFPGARLVIPRAQFSDFEGAALRPDQDQLAMVEQTRSLSHERIEKAAGRLSGEWFAKVEGLLRTLYGLTVPTPPPTNAG